MRVRGKISIYQGTREMVLTEPSQIWVVGEANQQEALVVRVIDGDTVEIEGEQRLRYIGIDAPEIACSTEPAEYFGEEAAEKNRELVWITRSRKYVSQSKPMALMDSLF